MRTNIDIDDDLLREAMKATELASKKAVVEEALRRLVLGYRQRQAIKNLEGVGWDGDLGAMRSGRSSVRNP